MLILLFAITLYLETNRQASEKEQMKYIASAVSAQTYEVLFAKLSKAETLEALIIKNNGGTEGFEKVAKLLVSDNSVRNVLLAPKGVVTDVYPLDGNENVLGYDIAGQNAGGKEAQDAIKKGEMIMAGPFELVQGGLGIAGRLPVYLNGEFWGIVSVTLNYPEVLGSMSSMQNLSAQGLGCELWRINADTGEHQTILSSGTGEMNRTLQLPFSIFNTQWNVTVYTEKPWYAHAFFWLCAATSLILSAVAAIVTYSLQTIQRMDKEMAQGRIRELNVQMERDRVNILLTQINSHFFYHTLNAIQALIVLEPDAAYKMTEDFAKFIRFRVDSVGVTNGLVSFKDEMSSVQAYADINMVQLGDRLKMEYVNIDANFMIPVLTVQPIVENAIVHGIKPKVGGGTVRISLCKTDDFYEVTVEDDGVGFSPDEAPDTASVGISNIKTRMEQHPGCSISVESVPGEGTRVLLRYPAHLL